MREGDALERLASVAKVAFDKTGTLTYGAPEVAEVCTILPQWPRQALYALAAGAELRSEHPLGKAIVRGYGKTGGPAPAQPTAFAMLPGRGVTAQVAGVHVAAGTQALLAQQGAEVPPAAMQQAAAYTAQGCTVIYLALDGAAAGFIALADTLRPDAAEVVGQVRACGPEPVLLTGDHDSAARTIAGRLGIKEFRAECLPEDKLAWIDASQQQGSPVCMIGDGVNDAPALKKAHVGIAMGGVGSDIAVDAADIALVNDDIKALPHLLQLAKKMMRTIQWNLAFSMALNFAAILLAMTGILNPVVGALVHNAGSVFVIIHSSLLLKWRKRA